MTVVEWRVRPMTMAALSFLAAGSMVGVSCIVKESRDQAAIRQKKEEITSKALFLVRDLDAVVELDVPKAVANKDPDARTNCRSLKSQIAKLEKLITGQEKVADPEPVKVPETSGERFKFIEASFKELKQLRGEVTLLLASQYPGGVQEKLCKMRGLLAGVEKAFAAEWLPPFNIKKLLEQAELIRRLKGGK